jgi:hypothetical protein
MPLFELSRGILASHGLSIAIDTSNSQRFKKALKEIDVSDNRASGMASQSTMQ